MLKTYFMCVCVCCSYILKFYFTTCLMRTACCNCYTISTHLTTEGRTGGVGGAAATVFSLKVAAFPNLCTCVTARAFNVYLFHPAAASLGEAFKDFPHLPLILNDIPECA